MIRRHVLAALATGVEAGDDVAAREALGRTEWLLRGQARRMLDHALIDAAMLTGEHGAADPEAMRHVQRVAALNVAGRIDVDVTDRAAVAATYYALEPEPAARAPVATIALVTSLLTFVSLAIWLVMSLRHPPRAIRLRTPLVTGAYFHGGTPARDAELETFLVDELTSLVIETDADRRGSRDGAPRARHIQELRNARVIAAHGPALAAAWRNLIDGLDRWSNLPVGGKHVREAVAELGRYAQDVSDQLAVLGLGYYLSADALLQRSAHAVVFVYRVDDVRFVRVGGQARRVLSLRRLDRLNLRLGLLGRQSDELGDPVVLLDQIEDFVRDKVTPAIDTGIYALGDQAFHDSSAGRLLGAWAARAISRELEVALGDAYADPARREAALRQLVTATVRRHEARHGVDLERDRPLRYPRALEQIAGKHDLSTTRTELELAAYVSQIANDPATPQLALWNLVSHAFNRDRWGSAESYAAVVVIQGLARQLGIEVAPAVKQGQLDRGKLLGPAHQLAAQGSEKLRMAARQLWIELYGEPMLPIVDVK
ncbi:MAG: hypothetical protein HOV81_18625 [Kofleriaceae bacterium]|nr:hypothetical protein [Kofleriaceae bacterium]